MSRGSGKPSAHAPHGPPPWLRTFLALPHGIPAHATFGRVFAALDPGRFEPCFLTWVRAAVTQTAGEVVALDGKTRRRSHDHGAGQGALHLVSAWATTTPAGGFPLVLGQVAVDAKSNEITALPALLQVLALNGCIVTIDAIGCQTTIAQTIVDLLRGDHSVKVGIKTKRLKAGWDEAYLLKLLNGYDAIALGRCARRVARFPALAIRWIANDTD